MLRISAYAKDKREHGLEIKSKIQSDHQVGRDLTRDWRVEGQEMKPENKKEEALCQQNPREGTAAC